MYGPSDQQLSSLNATHGALVPPALSSPRSGHGSLTNPLSGPSVVDPVTIEVWYPSLSSRWDGRLFPNNHLSLPPLSFGGFVGDASLDDTWLIQHQTLAKYGVKLNININVQSITLSFMA